MILFKDLINPSDWFLYNSPALQSYDRIWCRKYLQVVVVYSDSEGWEQNGLYEFFRAKMRARRKKGQEKRNR